MPSTRLDRPGLPRRVREQLGLIRLSGLRLRWRFSPPWEGYGEPFNGQQARREVIRRLIEQFQPDLFIETGTFLGDTTRYLSGFGAPVVTAELEPTFFRMARARLRPQRNVELVCGDSVGALRLAAGRRDHARPFVYLDAHWYERNPLAEEVEIVFGSWSDTLIVIDDFLVPGDPGYAYDEWRGQPLADAMLELPPDAVLAYPATPHERETGAIRGAAFIGRGSAARSALERLVDEGLLRVPSST